MQSDKVMQNRTTKEIRSLPKLTFVLFGSSDKGAEP